MLLSPRRVVVAAALGLALILAVVISLLIVQTLRPRVSQEAATAIALSQLQQENSSVTGYVLVRARYDSSPGKIYDDNGNLIESQSRAACWVLGLQLPSQLCTADAVWILHFHAPAQGSWANYDAYVVVNASNGTVSSASLVGQN
jgi:hypothetical protein